ncbi:MAG: transferase hexapeptide repeat family protein [Nonlabens sp.]
MFYSFKSHVPVVDESAFVHPLAAVIGNVIIGANCYVGAGAVIRGDWGEIILKNGVNVQENCTIHMFPGKSIVLQEGAHVGHGAVIHGAHLGKNCLIGMNSVIMDDASIGAGCIVGAMSFVKAGEQFEERSLIVGNPAKVIKKVTDQMLEWKTAGTRLYQQLPLDCHETMQEVEPLRELPKNRPVQEDFYKTLSEFKKKE